MTGRPQIPPRVWQLDAASLSDANKALRVLPRELRPYTHGVRMVGRAVTVAASGDLVPVLAGLEQCEAGDILVGDDDGIVVLSDAELDAALETAEAIQRREGTIRASIQGGTSLFEQLNFTEHLESLQSGRPSSLTFTVE